MELNSGHQTVTTFSSTDMDTNIAFDNKSFLSENISATNSSNLTDYDYYIYDYEESVNTIPLGELVPVAMVYGITLLLGVVGNLLVIFSIMRYRRMQNVTNIFLTSLASADMLLVLICIPIKVS